MLINSLPLYLKVLKRSLEMQFKAAHLSYEIVTVEGGREAVELYKQRRPSLSIIDYHMPEVDGIEATQLIRTYERQHDLPISFIVSYTADATERAKKLILESGVDEIMCKPAPKGTIEHLVSRLPAVEQS